MLTFLWICETFQLLFSLCTYKNNSQ